jgi:hypothetical protein
MTIEAVDLRIRSLTSTVEDSAEGLLALELDPTRQLLEKSTLEGATAAAWASTSSALIQAWEAQAALEDHVHRVGDLRGSRTRVGRDRLRELEALVDGRVLAAPSSPGVRRSAAELLSSSAAAVEDARRFVARVAEVWDALVPRLTTANATLRACAELRDELGATPGDDVTETRTELARVTAAVAADPLAVTAESVDALEAAVAAVRARVEGLRDFRADSEARLERARHLLAAVRRADSEARAAHAAALEKIAGPGVPVPMPLPADLAGELDDAAGLARSGAWAEADDAVSRWHARATAVHDAARQVEAANLAPIAVRDELRRRLDAYRSKASRLRLLEDRELAAVYARAQRVLYAAPTDLGEAADLLRLYQVGLSSRVNREILG